MREPRLNLGPALRASYGAHRSGLKYGLENLLPLHNPRGILLDAFVDIFFVSGDTFGNKTRLRPWAGLIHIPHDIPDWYTPFQSNETIFASDAWQESLSDCRGLFTMSEYHRKALAGRFAFPINRLFLPSEVPDVTWSWDRFLENRCRKIVQVGWWLRELHAIYRLVARGYEKVFLRVNHPILPSLLDEERQRLEAAGLFDSSMYADTTTIPFLDDADYDALLAENIVFLKLYTASANNAIVECIVRNTPVLVNRLEPIMEYLGASYPFYFNTLEEAAEKAENLDLVRETHLYLRDLPQKDLLAGESFLRAVEESEIYRRLPADNPRPMISVITPIAQRGTDIARTIASVEAQGYESVEHVLVDHSSNGRAITSDQGHPCVRVAIQTGSSQAQALNKGHELAQGEIITFLEPGSGLPAGAFETIVPCFLDGAVLVAGKIVVRQDEQARASHAEVAGLAGHRLVAPLSAGLAGCFYLRRAHETVGGFVRPDDDGQAGFLWSVVKRHGRRKIEAPLAICSSAIEQHLKLQSHCFKPDAGAPERLAERYRHAKKTGRSLSALYWGVRWLYKRTDRIRFARVKLRRMLLGADSHVFTPAALTDGHWRNGIAVPARNGLIFEVPSESSNPDLRTGTRLLFARSGPARVTRIMSLEQEGRRQVIVLVDKKLDPEGDGHPHPVVSKGRGLWERVRGA